METDTDMDIEGESNRGLFQMHVCIAGNHRKLKAVSSEVLELSGDQQQRELEDAEMELALAIASMGAARHIALRGGGGAPSSASPLESVDDLAADPDVCCALECLEKAEALATDVHGKVEAARGHLGEAALLRVRPVGVHPFLLGTARRRQGAPVSEVEGEGTRRRDRGRERGGVSEQRQH